MEPTKSSSHSEKKTSILQVNESLMRESDADGFAGVAVAPPDLLRQGGTRVSQTGVTSTSCVSVVTSQPLGLVTFPRVTASVSRTNSTAWRRQQNHMQ